MSNLIPQERIENKILLLRGLRVMIDKDLAELYGVETGQLKRQVKRNIERFPEDFMFELTREEYQDFLRCQFGTLEKGAYSKYLPYAFTEQGVAMLSSVLKSKRAVIVNIQIMRIFTKLRQILSTHEDIKRKLEAHDKQFSVIFLEINKINRLLAPPEKPKKKIGFL